MKYEKAVNSYKKTKKKLGRVPLRKELSKNARTAISKVYPNWFMFLDSQGDYQNSSSNPKSSRFISNEQIIMEIREIYHQLGYPPHVSDYKRSPTAINHFGSWQNTLKICGIKATFAPNARVSKEECLYYIKKEMDKIGSFPESSVLYSKRIPIHSDYKYYWKNIKEIAGEFNTKPASTIRYEKEAKLIHDAVVEMIANGEQITMAKVLSKTRLSTNIVRSFLQRSQHCGLLKHKSLIEYVSKLGGEDASLTRIVYIKGKKYDSFASASRKLHIGDETLKARIQQYGNNFEFIDYRGHLAKHLPTINGKLYPSIQACAKEHRIDPNTLAHRLKCYGYNSEKLFQKGRIK